jgi:hypothetical protein
MRATCFPIFGAVLFMTTFAIAAQQLRDPTRPPSEEYKVGASGARESRSGMVLQTVLISPDRQAAVISGRLMSLGDTISGFRLAEIHESEVVMKGHSGTRTLRLFPDVHMSDSQLVTRSEQTKDKQ